MAVTDSRVAPSIGPIDSTSIKSLLDDQFHISPSCLVFKGKIGALNSIFHV